MNRIEFVNLIKEARKESAKSIKDIVFALDIMPPEIYRIENGKTACSMLKYIDYLNALKCTIRLSHNRISKNITKYEDLVAWEKIARGDLSKKAFSDLLGVANDYISDIEAQRIIMSVDKFLKIAEVTGYTIEVVKIK